MTPFSHDQLAAVLDAADPIGCKGRTYIGTSDLLKAAGHNDAAKYLDALGLTALSGYYALINLALHGLPEDLALEVREEDIERGITSLACQVLNGALPPSAILDALGEFLARPGQPLDMPAGESVPVALVVGEQFPLDQTGINQQGDVLGKDVLLDIGQKAQAAGAVANGQDNAPDQVHITHHASPLVFGQDVNAPMIGGCDAFYL